MAHSQVSFVLLHCVVAFASVFEGLHVQNAQIPDHVVPTDRTVDLLQQFGLMNVPVGQMKRSGAGACTVVTAVSTGGPCYVNTTNYPANQASCVPFGAVNCASNTANNGYVCTAGKAAGATCTYGFECGMYLGAANYQSGMGVQLVCTAGTCQKPTSYASENDECSATADCRGGTCTGGVCVGFPPGTACANSAQCAGHYYCSGTTSTCVPWIAVGGSCSDPSAECASPAGCGVGQICTTPYLKAAGAACVSIHECEQGLLCGAAGTCIAAPAPHRVCANNATCASTGGYCNPCGLISGGPECSGPENSVPCIPAYQKLGTCGLTHGCYGLLNSWPGSCSAKFCATELACFNQCIVSAALPPSLFAAAGPLPSCPVISLATSLKFNMMLLFWGVALVAFIGIAF